MAVRTMTDAEFRRFGELLYGPTWQSQCARGLSSALGRDVKIAHVSRWASGERPVPRGISQACAALANDGRKILVDRAFELHLFAQQHKREAWEDAPANEPID